MKYLLFLLLLFFGVGFSSFAQDRIAVPSITNNDSILTSISTKPSKKIRKVRDSLMDLQPVPEQLIHQIDLLLLLRKADAETTTLVIDSLLEDNSVPSTFIEIIQQQAELFSPPTYELPYQLEPGLDSAGSGGDQTIPSWYQPVAASLEVRAGDTRVVNELRIYGNLLPRLNYFSWTTTSVDYSNNVSYLNILDLYVPVWGGLSLMQETQFGNAIGADIRFGFWYFNVWGNFAASFIGTTNVEEVENWEFLSAAQYTPKLNKNIRWLFKTETLTVHVKGGHLFSGERVRAGILYKDWQLGLVEDFLQIGDRPEHDRIHAVFFRKSF